MLRRSKSINGNDFKGGYLAKYLSLDGLNRLADKGIATFVMLSIPFIGSFETKKNFNCLVTMKSSGSGLRKIFLSYEVCQSSTYKTCRCGKLSGALPLEFQRALRLACVLRTCSFWVEACIKMNFKSKISCSWKIMMRKLPWLALSILIRRMCFWKERFLIEVSFESTMRRFGRQLSWPAADVDLK